MASASLAIRSKKRDIVAEFDRYFGNDSHLANWQRLCHDIGLQDDLPSIKRCRVELKKAYVNICDLLDAVRAGRQPRRFKNAGELAKYTVANRKWFPKAKAKQSGPARALLVHVF